MSGYSALMAKYCCIIGVCEDSFLRSVIYYDASGECSAIVDDCPLRAGRSAPSRSLGRATIGFVHRRSGTTPVRARQSNALFLVLVRGFVGVFRLQTA